MRNQRLSTDAKFDTQKSFTRMGEALDILLNFVEKNPERLDFCADDCCGQKKTKTDRKKIA